MEKSFSRANDPEVFPAGVYKKWVEIMNAIVRSFVVLVSLLALIACSMAVPFDNVCGAYRASDPFGTEILRLNRDGSFVQQ
jgi:hypothetical protein